MSRYLFSITWALCVHVCVCVCVFTLVHVCVHACACIPVHVCVYVKVTLKAQLHKSSSLVVIFSFQGVLYHHKANLDAGKTSALDSLVYQFIAHNVLHSQRVPPCPPLLWVLTTATRLSPGMKYPLVRCLGCKVDGIAGMLWRCVKCSDYYLCSLCYTAGRHSIEHEFLRIDDDEQTLRYGTFPASLLRYKHIFVNTGVEHTLNVHTHTSICIVC